MKSWTKPEVKNLDVKETETETLGCWNPGGCHTQGDKQDRPNPNS